jgi:hypothetical protein
MSLLAEPIQPAARLVMATELVIRQTTAPPATGAARQPR